MGSLNNIRRHGVKGGKTVPLVLNMISEKHVFHVEHLGQSNYGFVNDSLRGAGSEAVKLARATANATTPEQLGRLRDANRETVAKHAVRSIEGFCYDGPNGEPNPTDPVPSNPLGIAEAVNSLPDDIFDLVLVFVLDAEKFRDTPIALDPESVAKKS